MFAWIFGDDVFVSYARRDGLRYAAGLSAALIDRGLSCRTDLWDTVPGRQLPLKLRLSIRSSYMLVIIGTPAAAASQAVMAEIEEFRKTRRNIVVVDVEGAASGAIWHEQVLGLPFEVEPSTEALVTGSPSASVVARIVQSHSFLKKSQRLRRAFWITAMGIATLIAAGALTVALVRREVEEQRQIGTALRLAAEARAERSRLGYTPLPQVVGALEAGRILMDKGMDLDAAAILSDGVELLPEVAWTRRGSFSFTLAALDPARERLFVGEGSGRVAIHDAANGDAVAPLQHASEVRALALSGDGELAATSTADGQAFVWEVSGKPKVVASFACPEAFGAAATFSPDSSYVAMRCEESLVVRKLGSDRDWTIPRFLSISGVGFSADNRYLFVSETEDGYFRLYAWEVATGNQVPYETLRGLLGSPSRRFEFSPDGRYLASSCWDPEVPPSDCTVRVYDATSLKLVSQMPQAGPTENTFSADGKLLATMGGSDVRVWSTEDARLLSILSGVGGATVEFSARGEYFAAVDSELALVVESTSGRVASAIPRTGGRALRSFLFAAPLRFLSVDDEAIVMWRAEGAQRRTGFPHAGVVEDAEMAASGDRAVTYYSYVSEEEGAVATLWDLDRGEVLFRSPSWIDGFALRIDGEQLAILTYEGLELWEISERGDARRLRAPWREAGVDAGRRWRQVFHHASRGWIGLLEPDDGGAELWLLERDERLAVLPESTVQLTQVSAGGRFLLVGDPPDSFVLNLTTLARRTISLPSAARPVGIFCLESEADCLVTYHTEDATRILRTGSGETVLDLSERLWEVRFDEAAQFAVALASGNVRVWDLSNGEVLFASPSEGGVPVGFRRDDSQVVVAQGKRLVILRWRPRDLLDEGCRRLSSIVAIDPELRRTLPQSLVTACPTAEAR